MEEVYAAPWRPATQLGDTWKGLTGFHLEHGAARKTSNCTWDVGVIALQLGHHKAQQLQMHKHDLAGLQLEPCCTLETTETGAEEMHSASWRPATVVLSEICVQHDEWHLHLQYTPTWAGNSMGTDTDKQHSHSFHKSFLPHRPLIPLTLYFSSH